VYTAGRRAAAWYGMLRPMFGLLVDDEIRLAMPLDRHAAPIYALIEAERDRLERWLPMIAEMRSVEQQREHNRKRRLAIADGSLYSFVIEVGGVPAGTIGMEPDLTTAELGYMLGSRFEGRGIVTRSLAALITVAIADLAIHRFEIQCAPDNERSKAVAARLGFAYEGTRHQSARVADGWQDAEVHVLFAPDWPAAAGT
jgi:ribosomal-protein-serine acetyltransferase